MHDDDSTALGSGSTPGSRAAVSRVDSTLACYAVGLAASFGISHVDLIHNNLSRYFPKTYPTLNVILPCGRALFGLGILARAAELAEAPRNG